MSKREQHPFVQERLERLHEIDSRLVSLLNHSSATLTDLTNLKKNAYDEDELVKTKEDFQQDIKNFLTDLEWASVSLKREIKTLDDRIGRTDSNGITILPININKKATWAGEEKLRDQLNILEHLISGDDVKEDKKENVVT